MPTRSHTAALRVTAFAVWASTLTLAVAQQPASSNAAAAGRFDYVVRADLFAGFAGDTARFARAMARCEEELARNPEHPEALVWRGSGVMFQAGTAFQQGDARKGVELWQRALADMNRAVSLAPDNAAVRIPRGATLLDASRYAPPAQAAALLKLALDDYEHTLRLQEGAGEFATLSSHAKGELLFGLAEGWARAGEPATARRYFLRLAEDAPDSGRIAYAKAWLAGKPPAQVGRCTGCHEG